MSEARFTVFATNVSPDDSTISRDLGRQALGKMNEAALAQLLEKFAALAGPSNDDCDPHLTVAGRSGTFAIRAAAGASLLVYDVTDVSRNYLKLRVENVAAFLDYGPSGLPPEPAALPVTDPIVAEATSAPPPPRSNLKPALALFGALAGLAALAVSSQLSFSPQPLDAEVPYTPVTSASEIAAVRARATGDYHADNDTQCSLSIRPDGTIHYVTREIDGDIAWDRVVSSELALLANQSPVFRTEIGPIEIRDASTVRFAGETFTRKR